MNGNFSFDKIVTIDFNKVYDYSISFTDTTYIICVDNIHNIFDKFIMYLILNIKIRLTQ